jgi:phosphomevalonate kinase
MIDFLLYNPSCMV